MAKIIIVRHGETVESVKNILLGQKDGTLTENGKEEVKAFAEKLRRFEIESIVSSDLARAADTARIYAEKLGIEDIEMVKTIRERSSGVYEGKFADEVDWESYEKVEFENRKHEEGESFFEVEKRIKSYLDIVSDMERNTLIVTHSVVMHIIWKILQETSFEEAMKLDIDGKFLIVDEGKLECLSF